FLIIGGAIASLGLIPQISQGFMTLTDNIAVNWFGARIGEVGKTNPLWWFSIVDRATEVPFTMNMWSMGFGMLGIFIGLIFASPTSWRKRIKGSIVALVTIIPLNFLRLGFQKWAVWSLANNDTMRKNQPYKMDIKAVAIIVAWFHQIWYWLAGILGLRKKEEDDDLFEKEKQPEKSAT
ncbi:MAG: hypothetical protein ACTSR1_13690, partial [Candidatus Heimdallarchaeota archaeon]